MSSQPPFELGDRVDHPKFGLATVCEPPEGGPNHWRITIQPDGPSQTVKTISHSVNPKGRFLRLVSSPDAKGERYWRLKYEDLVVDVMSATQRKLDFLKDAFRQHEPGEFEQQLKFLQDDEAEAEEKLLSFIQNDDAGHHP